MPRKGAVARDDPAAAPFFVHSFEDSARDRDIGKAEPNRTTRNHDTQQEVEPEIGFGAGGVRSWNKLDCGRLYDVAFGFFSPECREFCSAVYQQSGRTAAASESFRSGIE